MKYIPADKLIAEIERLLERANRRTDKEHLSHNSEMEKFGEDYWNGYGDLAYSLLGFITSLQQEQPEVDYNIIPLPEEKMARYIDYCLKREDDECHCPTCGKFVTGLRLFPYYYDRENNDVYFASVCPECGKIIISKE
jgi:endogenous inhibitor of DNA gyrase (YacG/DUF329 family)